MNTQQNIAPAVTPEDIDNFVDRLHNEMVSNLTNSGVRDPEAALMDIDPLEGLEESD